MSIRKGYLFHSHHHFILCLFLEAEPGILILVVPIVICRQRNRQLANARACIFIQTLRVKKEDVVIPYSQWFLGPSDFKSFEDRQDVEPQAVETLREKIGARPDLEIQVMEIHGEGEIARGVTKTLQGLGEGVQELVWFNIVNRCFITRNIAKIYLALIL